MEDSGSSYASPFRNRSRVGQPGRLPSHVYSQVTDCLADFTLTPRLTLGCSVACSRSTRWPRW